MLKKLTGIFILLCFFLVKSTPLLAMDNYRTDVVSCCPEQAADDVPDAEKEVKQLEITDEDFIQASITVPGFLMLTSKTTFFNSPRISTPYISLPYPPPNGR